MTGAVRLRGGTPKDASVAAEIWVAAGDARRAAAGLEPVEQVDEVAAMLRSRLADPAARLLLAEDGMTAIGMALVLPARTDDGAGPDLVPGLLHLSSVAVAPGRWRQGTGARLVAAALDVARSEAYGRVQLWVVGSNDGARRLYGRAGFVASGRTKPDEHGETIEHWVCELG